MADNESEPSPGRTTQPAWAEALRELYDAVVEEPLPDCFNDLLSKLDGSPDQKPD